MRYVLVCLALVACEPEPSAPSGLVLESFRPSEGQAILLNEPLSLTFSEEIDPDSVTPSSLQVLDAQGLPAAGEWRIQGRWLLFWPRTVVTADLSGGGYQPGMEHRVRVAGFPALGGLRTRSGEPLDQTYWLKFQVADPNPSDPSDPAFLDFTPYACSPIQFMSLPGELPAPVHWEDPLRLYAGEPLDPRTLRSKDFVILRHRLSPGPKESSREVYSEVRAVLIQNLHSELLEQHQAGAIVELIPKVPLEVDARFEYSLEVLPGAALADYSGHSPWPPRPMRTPLASYRFRLEPVGAHERNRMHLDFLQRGPLTSQEVPWATGEASWEPGRITVHFPKAAGSGEDGERSLLGILERSDLNATRLTVPLGAQASLPSEPVPAILRSQGRIELQGALVHRQPKFEGVTPAAWLASTSGGSLDDLIAFAEGQAVPWTILVAGGDLILSGSLDSDSPVILAAGGRTRITGKVRCPDGQLYLVGDGGSSTLGLEVQSLPLSLPAPSQNPLREMQTYCAVTSVLPNWALDRYEWQALSIGQVPGHGQVEVYFLPPDGPIEFSRCVSHPRHLPLDSPLRILIQLTVEPGDLWDPPVLDSIDLSWKAH